MDLNKIKLDRRKLLKAAGLGVAATGLSGPITSALASGASTAGAAKVGKDGKRLLPWSNWSGSQTSLPSLRLAPGSEDELIDMVKSSTQTIRCVGAGHSFNGLVPTDDTLMTLARMRGVESINLETQEADIWAGTQLGEIGEPLWEQGLAMINMPDINVQSLAGAIGTSTHGTGKHLGSVSSTVTSLRLVAADGELMECSADKNSDLFQAARTSLGSLGVISQARLQTQDAYNLRERTWFVPLEEGLDQIEDYRDNNRNYEAYFFPHGDYMMHITQEELDGDVPSIVAGTPSDGYETFRQISEVIDYIPLFMYSTIMNFGLRAELDNVEIKEGRSYQV
ncbi:MAG: FAD-binding protein, partial [Proteobacteria bacterium]|nr:FAD-binding protein [Pseudomonadota bacterium]